MAEHPHTVAIILVVAAMTAILRYLPFIVLRKKESTPPFVMYIGSVLPYAVMGMLVVYCLSSVDIGDMSSLMPNVIAVLVTALLQLWKHSLLLSVGVGTVLYMVLLQFVF